MVTKRFNFEPQLLEYGEVNSGFARVKLGIMTDEQIANGTHFNKEVINKRINGLNYLPVVMEYKEDKEDAGTHGGKIELSDDGIKFIDTTKPYGVVIANTAKWEDVKQKNGETIPYLTCEIYGWIERYPELECLYKGNQNNQSMEIKVLEAHFDENTWVYEIDDFEFSALCILGSDIQPAFDEAKVSTEYSKQDFKANYTEMLNALNIYLQNNGKEVFSLDEEILEVENTEEFEEIQEEKLENEEEFKEEVLVEEVVIEETTEEEFVEEKEPEEVIDYQKLYDDLKIEYDKLVISNGELSDYKSTKEKEEEQAQFEQEKAEKQEVFNAFSNKLDSEEMQPIVDKMDNLSKDEIELQLFALVGKKSDDNKLDFSKNEKHKIGLFDNDSSDMTDGLRAVISRKKK